MKDDFYIGYLPKMPEKPARVMKIVVLSLFVAAILLAAALWAGQKPFAKSYFEFGSVKAFEGTIRAGAVPFLLVEKSEKTNGLPAFERFPLVGEGKRGAEVQALDGERVKLKGTLIYRDNLRMIEVAAGSLEKLGATGGASEQAAETLGFLTLRGEIVDAKCYLGVMNPGSAKPHRECAVRCISGGVPPLFSVKDEKGNVSQLWLVSVKGERVNREILDFVAEPVEMTGEVFRRGDQLFFHINPNQIKRLP